MTSIATALGGCGASIAVNPGVAWGGGGMPGGGIPQVLHPNAGVSNQGAGGAYDLKEKEEMFNTVEVSEYISGYVILPHVGKCL